MADRLRCEHGEWKTRDQFSKTQLEKYEQQARNGTATPARTGIRCKEHSAKQALELKCNGPCGRWRELRFFSKSTRRNGKNWCLDCTEWQLKTENGETLPAPGGQLSAEEMRPRLPHASHLRDEMVFEWGAGDFGGIQPASATDDMSSDFGGTASSSLAGEAPRSDANRMDNIIPPHLKGKGRAPHWLIPDTITESMIKSAEKASAMGSATTADAKQVKGIFFNAWGPNSEYARMMKTPTVVSDSASTRAETENLRPENLGKKGWARAPTRKQPPQLPDYLKYDIPFENHGDFEGDSDDNM